MSTLTYVEAIAQIAEYQTMLADLDAHRITPRSVVGTGYRNGRLVARSWIINQIRNHAEDIAHSFPGFELVNPPSDVDFRSAAKVTYGIQHPVTLDVIARYSK